jgi:hypothetical protein
MDPDLDTGGQKHADPADPDPQQWQNVVLPMTSEPFRQKKSNLAFFVNLTLPYFFGFYLWNKSNRITGTYCSCINATEGVHKWS